MPQTPPLEIFGQAARRFRAWWGTELATFLPGRLTGTIGLRHRLPVAVQGDHGLMVTDGAVKHAIPVWAARPKRRAVVLRLPAEAGLSRRITLPTTAAAALPQLLRREMDRLMPWPSDQVFLAAEVLHRLDGGRKVEVEMTVVPLAAIAAAKGVLDDYGVPIAALELNDPTGKRILLPPGAEMAATGTRRLRRMVLAAAAVFAMAVIGAGGALGWQIRQRDRAIDALQSRIAAARPAVDEVQRLRQEIAGLSGAQRFIDDKRRATPAASIALESVSRLLPDDVWLTDLSLADASLRAGGYAPDASALIGAFEESGRFADTRFLAPSARDRDTGRDRFSVGARIEPRLEP
jgi:general secretion pathway protein L